LDELKASVKPFRISKQAVWDAWLKVKGNKGAPGADGQSIEAFEADLKGNLYKVWNRMSSGTYFPPPVMAETPKPHGGGTRVLGVPCVADRIAQTVAAARLEAVVESMFHPDSYGYRPRRGAPDAVAACRERCWERSWVIDLDIRLGGGETGPPDDQDGRSRVTGDCYARIRGSPGVRFPRAIRPNGKRDGEASAAAL
jgi:RNA-directed DNA polymerase